MKETTENKTSRMPLNGFRVNWSPIRKPPPARKSDRRSKTPWVLGIACIIRRSRLFTPGKLFNNEFERVYRSKLFS